MDQQQELTLKAKVSSKKAKNEIILETVATLLALQDRQQLQEAIATTIKPISFKQKDHLQALLKEALRSKYYEEDRISQTSLDGLIQQTKEVLTALRDAQINSLIVDTFSEQFLSVLADARSQYPQQCSSKALLQLYQFIPFRNLEQYLSTLRLKEEYNNQDEQKFTKILIGLLNQKKIQQCCAWYLQYHPLPNFDTDVLAPRLAVSDQIYSTLVLEMLKVKPSLKENVIKLIDLSKAVPLLQNLGEDPRDYEEVNKYILKKHHHSCTHQYKQWPLFEDKMDFNPMFIEWYCNLSELDEQVKYSMLVRNGLKQAEEGRPLIPNPLFQNDCFNVTDVLLLKNGQTKQQVESEYLRLIDYGFSEEDVYFVDDDESELFKKMSGDVLSSKEVGFDAENRCTSTKYQQQGGSLIQLSTQKSIYIIDFLKLESSDNFIKFFKQFLSCKELLKVGHTVQSDIKYLSRTIEIQVEEIESFVDLVKIFKEKYPFDVQNSLAFMCDKLLGKKLSKYEQRSNWNRRPIKKTQKHYAALDASICIEIYHFLLDQKVDTSGSVGVGKKKSKEADELVRNENLVYAKSCEGVLQAERPKFLIDSMLKKLCSMMRNLGIDCEYLSVSNFEIMKDIAEKEQRIILTRDTKLLAKRSHKMPIYCIAEKGDSDKMFEEIKIQFKLDLGLFKPLSRCVKCNCGELEVISKAEAMKAIVFQYEDSKIEEFWQCVKCKQIYWEGNQFLKAKTKYTQMNG